MKHRNLLLATLGLVGLTLLATMPANAQKHKHSKPTKATSKKGGKPSGTRGQVAAVIEAFEQAYAKKDKATMLQKLMYPTTDKNVLNKRLQWLRGYSLDEDARSVRPPILFTTAPGSYVPTGYKLISANPIDGANWGAIVEEKGSCREEGKKFSVERRRNVTLIQVKGKWYINNYYNKENPDEFGFWVDDITDKMVATK